MLVGALLKGKVLIGTFSEYCVLWWHWCQNWRRLSSACTVCLVAGAGGGLGGWWVVATLQVWTRLAALSSECCPAPAQPRPELDSILLHNLGPLTASASPWPHQSLLSAPSLSLCRAPCSVSLLLPLLPTLRGGMLAVSNGIKHSKPLHGTAHQFCIIIRSKKLHFVQQFCVPNLLIMYS